MNLDELKSVPNQAVEALEADGWTVEKLSAASVKELTNYQGIGKATAQNIITEAQGILDRSMLAEAETPDDPARQVAALVEPTVQKLMDGGLTLQVLALSPVESLTGYKGISRELAAKIISHAQAEVNRQGLYESSQMDAGIVNNAPYKGTSAAFPEEWLSGAVEPPPMSVRVKRIFDQAKAEYEAENG